MKIELRKYLSDKITNFNLLRQMLVTLDKMPFENKKKLIKTLKECDYNENAYKVAVNFKVLEKRTIEIFNKIKIKEEKGFIELKLKEFNEQDIVIIKRIIIYTISKTIGNVQNIEKVNIDDIIKLCEKNIGNKYLMPNKNIKILVNKNQIFFEAKL